VPDLRLVVVPHPIGGIRPPDVEAKGRAAADALLEALTGVSEAARTGAAG
jgi:hypothetical protein